tara:strand:+ start:288 stop:488 length:201 start_codon:yes stop_codon:yes gene_type:complete
MKIKNVILFILVMAVMGMFLVSCDGIQKTGQAGETTYYLNCEEGYEPICVVHHQVLQHLLVHHLAQ